MHMLFTGLECRSFSAAVCIGVEMFSHHILHPIVKGNVMLLPASQMCLACLQMLLANCPSNCLQGSTRTRGKQDCHTETCSLSKLQQG